MSAKPRQSSLMIFAAFPLRPFRIASVHSHALIVIIALVNATNAFYLVGIMDDPMAPTAIASPVVLFHSND